jgi:hypothetical protein
MHPRAVRIALVALIAAGVVLSSALASATQRRQQKAASIEVHFVVSGDLRSVSGRVSSRTCFPLPAPDPFSVVGSNIVPFELQAPPCELAQLEWRIRTAPKSPHDPPESIAVVVHYTYKSFRPWVVECQELSPDVRCYVEGHLGSKLTVVNLSGR